MALHLAGFYEDIDPGGALVNIAGIADQALTVTGDDVRVPSELPFLVGAAGLIGDASGARCQVSSPSLRRLANIDVAPFPLADVYGDPPEADIHPRNAIQLRGDEALNFLVNSNPAAAELHHGFVWLADGPVPEVSGEVFTVRATAAVTAVVGTWVNGGLTFDQDLPVGNYQVVGMRCEMAGAVAARLVFVGGAWRPGCLAVVSEDDNDLPVFRQGRMGVWGQFHTNTPPTVDFCAASAAVTPAVYLDIIPVG